jgi:ABC-type hemin transport system ATPase subunit
MGDTQEDISKVRRQTDTPGSMPYALRGIGKQVQRSLGSHPDALDAKMSSEDGQRIVRQVRGGNLERLAFMRVLARVSPVTTSKMISE